MNTKQLNVWKELAQQCQTQCTKQFYSSINVASKVRSEAIVAADALVELVTPELASLLDDLAAGCDHSAWLAAERGWAMAARIREALALEVNDEG